MRSGHEKIVGKVRTFGPLRIKAANIVLSQAYHIVNLLDFKFSKQQFSVDQPLRKLPGKKSRMTAENVVSLVKNKHPCFTIDKAHTIPSLNFGGSTIQILKRLPLILYSRDCSIQELVYVESIWHSLIVCKSSRASCQLCRAVVRVFFSVYQPFCLAPCLIVFLYQWFSEEEFNQKSFNIFQDITKYHVEDNAKILNFSHER